MPRDDVLKKNVVQDKKNEKVQSLDFGGLVGRLLLYQEKAVG
jgi:hypothetical protein